MKVYVEREQVVEFLTKIGATELIPRIKELLTTAVSEDGKCVFHSYGSKTKIIENVGTMNLTL